MIAVTPTPETAPGWAAERNNDRVSQVSNNESQQEGSVNMSDKVSNLTDATFDEIVNGSAEPVIVDFWAEWCGPCKMVAPILDEIAEEQDGSVKVTKLNVDENPSTAQRFGVMSIPTMLVFRDGELDKRIVGAKGKAQLMEELGL